MRPIDGKQANIILATQRRNIVETVGDNGSLITQCDYACNIKGDPAFYKEALDKIGHVEKKAPLVSDGAFVSIQNQEQASKQNIRFVPTNLTGLHLDKINGDFQINEDETIHCPAGHTSFKSRRYENPEVFYGWFEKETCVACPLFDSCKPKLQAQTTTVKLSKEAIARTQHFQLMASDEFEVFTNFRNGIEGVPSILRRRYHVDQMPVRGFLLTKIWFSFKIGAINIKSLIKGTKQQEKQSLKNTNFNLKRLFKNDQAYLVPYPEFLVA